MIKTDLHLKFLMIATIATLVHGVAVRADGDEVKTNAAPAAQLSLDGPAVRIVSAEGALGFVEYFLIDDKGQVEKELHMTPLSSVAFGLKSVPELHQGEKRFKAEEYEAALKLYSIGFEKTRLMDLPWSYRALLHYRMMKISDKAGDFRLAVAHYVALSRHMSLSNHGFSDPTDLQPMQLPAENRPQAVKYLKSLIADKEMSRSAKQTLERMVFALEYSDRTTAPIQRGTSVIYVIDATGSTSETVPFIVKAVKESIRGLRSRNQGFNVVTFNAEGVKQFQSEAQGIDAGIKKVNIEHKRKALVWLSQPKNVMSKGEASAHDALVQAITQEPDMIFLLSDGLANKNGVTHNDDALLKAVKEARQKVGIPVKINCIQFLGSDSSQLMMKLAEENGGQFKQLDAKYLGIEK